MIIFNRAAKCILESDWEVIIYHISKNKYKAADIMAKLGPRTLQGLYTIDHIVSELEKQLIEDGMYPIHKDVVWFLFCICFFKKEILVLDEGTALSLPIPIPHSAMHSTLSYVSDAHRRTKSKKETEEADKVVLGEMKLVVPS